MMVILLVMYANTVKVLGHKCRRVCSDIICLIPELPNLFLYDVLQYDKLMFAVYVEKYGFQYFII
jgi:hypothetical protein